MTAAAVSGTNHNLFYGVAYGAKKVVKGAAQVQGNAAGFGRICKLIGYAFAGYQYSTGKSAGYERFRETVAVTDNLIDTAQAFDAADSAVNPKAKKLTPLEHTGNIAFLGAGILDISSLLHRVKLIDLSRITGLISRIPVAGVVARVAIGTLSGGLVAVGFSCLTVKSLNKALHEKESLKKRDAMLETAANISQIALCILTIAAAANVLGILTLGVATATLGTASFLHHIYVEDVEKAKK